jgi:hypothetical protein
MSQKNYDPNLFSTRTLDPFEIPKIVELDSNNNVILPKSSQKQSNQFMLQEVYNNRNQNYNQYYSNQPKTFIVEDENGNELTRIISSQSTFTPNNLMLQPSYILQTSPVMLNQQQAYGNLNSGYRTNNKY